MKADLLVERNSVQIKVKDNPQPPGGGQGMTGDFPWVGHGWILSCYYANSDYKLRLKEDALCGTLALRS